MAIVPTRSHRYGLALLVAAAIAGCSSGGTDNTNPGTITLSVSPNNGTVQQGGQLTTVATLTRGGGFTGTVNLTVTGAPAGVTAQLSNVQTSGTTTTATVTIVVAGTTVAGVYQLVAHGTGTGVTEATANYTLTVTAAPAPAYTLTLSSATVSIVQGASTPTINVTLARTNFTGNVTFSVDNLPTGVTAAFVPNNTATSASVLTLTVAGTAVPGATNLTVRGAATGLTDRTAPLALTVTAPAPSFTLSLTQATLSIAQGASTPTTTVNINRTNFPGDVALSVLNLPTGVTASFAPANPQTTSSSVLTLTVAPGAPTGTFTNLSVQGVGTPGTVSTPLSLTITAGVPAGNFTLSTTPATAVGVTQGANVNVTVNINRTGGNTSDIALTATGTLPTGMTLAFLPTSTTGASSVLTVTTTGATPVGATPIVIHGNTASLGEQTVNLTINVSAPGGSGNVTLSFATCTTDNKAAWVAFMNGTSGTWTAVTGTADVYNFNITQSKGSIAYVTLGTGSSVITVLHFTQAELIAGTLNFCAAPTPGNTYNGTVANFPGGFQGRVTYGGGTANVLGNGAFQITNALLGAFPLIGYAWPLGTGGGDRVFIQRDEDPSNGGSFSSAVDFQHATKSASATIGAGTLTGLAGTETQIFHQMTYYTGGNACTPSLLYFLRATAASFSFYGVPASLRVAGDVHSISISAISGPTSFRILTENFVDITTRALTPFVLPAPLPVPVVSDAGGPYKRLMVVATGVSAEYNISHTMTYVDQTAPGKSGVVTASQGWVGGANVTLVLPDFTGVGTFNAAWAPATGDGLAWFLSSSGGTFTNVCTDGQRFLIATRSGSLP